jgi:hypothetical protein
MPQGPIKCSVLLVALIGKRGQGVIIARGEKLRLVEATVKIIHLTSFYPSKNIHI